MNICNVINFCGQRLLCIMSAFKRHGNKASCCYSFIKVFEATYLPLQGRWSHGQRASVRASKKVRHTYPSQYTSSVCVYIQVLCSHHESRSGALRRVLSPVSVWVFRNFSILYRDPKCCQWCAYCVRLSVIWLSPRDVWKLLPCVSNNFSIGKLILGIPSQAVYYS